MAIEPTIDDAIYSEYTHVPIKKYLYKYTRPDILSLPGLGYGYLYKYELISRDCYLLVEKTKIYV